MATIKKVPPKQITSWSFSRYSTYKTCPLKLKLNAIDKIAEPPNDAMKRGTDIHTLAEEYVKGKISRLPKELKLFEGEFKKLKAKYKKGALTDIMVEDNWAFTNQWLGTVWNDWVNCWVRIKLDLAHLTEPGILEVIDWKTGKFRQENNEDYLEQLELYALGAFLTLPQINEVRPKLKYLDHGITYPPEGADLIYKRSDLPKLKKVWEKRVKAMMNDKIFAPKPNNLCKWCFYRKSNKSVGGGQCKF